MFFTSSKILWFFVQPANLLLIVLLVTAALSFFGTKLWALRLLRISACLALAIAVFPIGQYVVINLENRFPENPDLPDKIHGIIILGGVIDPSTSSTRKSPQIGGAVERITVGAALAKRFPAAKIIFSGGSGNIFDPEAREAFYAPPIFKQLGLSDGRVTFEDKARNTAENARYARLVGTPTPGENWILVTSAFHMPRAVGVFRKADWPVIPYPVDFSTSPNAGFSISFSLQDGLSRLSGALHEVIGLVAYYLSGRTDTLYPGPRHRS